MGDTTLRYVHADSGDMTKDSLEDLLKWAQEQNDKTYEMIQRHHQYHGADSPSYWLSAHFAYAQMVRRLHNAMAEIRSAS